MNRTHDVISGHTISTGTRSSFLKLRVPMNGIYDVVSSYAISTGFPRVDG